ncbi:hypothetical protein Bca101_043814 [Brassica carinata]
MSDMEWVPEPLVGEPPKKKQGRPPKFSALGGDAFEGSQEPGKCDVLVHMEKKSHTVRDYLKEFVDTPRGASRSQLRSGAGCLWQGSARTFGTSLRSGEDPETDDDPLPSARGASAIGPESEADRASPHHGG